MEEPLSQFLYSAWVSFLSTENEKRVRSGESSYAIA